MAELVSLSFLFNLQRAFDGKQISKNELSAKPFY